MEISSDSSGGSDFIDAFDLEPISVEGGFSTAEGPRLLDSSYDCSVNL